MLSGLLCFLALTLILDLRCVVHGVTRPRFAVSSNNFHTLFFVLFLFSGHPRSLRAHINIMRETCLDKISSPNVMPSFCFLRGQAFLRNVRRASATRRVVWAIAFKHTDCLIKMGDGCTNPRPCGCTSNARCPERFTGRVNGVIRFIRVDAAQPRHFETVSRGRRPSMPCRRLSCCVRTTR